MKQPKIIEVILYIFVFLLFLALLKINRLEAEHSIEPTVDEFYEQAGFEDLTKFINKINCSNLNGSDQAMCIYYAVANITGFKYKNCNDTYYTSVIQGTCCRDWSYFWSKLFDYYGWDYQYILYPKLNHMRVDVNDNQSYCMIDIKRISCYSIKKPKLLNTN